MGTGLGRRIELVRRAPGVSQGPNGDPEFRYNQVMRELEHLRHEVGYLKDANRFKDLMLEDEATFLQEALEGGEAPFVEALKRRISRLKGAINHGR